MTKPMVRKPVVAGQFYPAGESELREEIGSFIKKGAVPKEVIACLLPHAGYTYSGKVTGETVSQIKMKDNFILLGPNHTGYGPGFSIMTEGSWYTPLGEIKINSNLAKKILEHSRYLESDTLAHAHEHSLEVILPFLQYFKNNFEFVPIIITFDNTSILKEIGEGIARAIQELRLADSTVIVCSSDFTHYEPQLQAEKKDKTAISAILALNEDKLTAYVQSLNISMCGYAPSVIMLAAAKLLGAKTASLVRYQTSAEITGDEDSVVGYAGILVN
ncbi:AmmeMemoRadiSam system protein B [bacterium]|nr:MAG: AmmeMemoRadiSam system protein B [bacterium]